MANVYTVTSMSTVSSTGSECTESLILLKLSTNNYNDIRYIHKLINTNQLRDYDDLYTDPQFYTLLFNQYNTHTAQYDQLIDQQARPNEVQNGLNELHTIYTIIISIIGYTEFNAEFTHNTINKQLIDRIIQRFHPRHQVRHSSIGGAGSTGLSNVPQAILNSVGIFNTPSTASNHEISNKQEYPLIRTLLHSIYHKCIYIRPLIRQQLITFMSRYIRSSGNTHSGIGDVIALWASIINGCMIPLKQSYIDTLHKCILPLHTIEHTLLSQFHDRLTYCIISYIKQDNTLCVPVINKLVDTNIAQHTSKHVLILHELESILELITDQQFQHVLQPFMIFLIYSLQSIQFQIAERAAQLFQNTSFVSLIQQNSTVFINHLLPVVTMKHWNKTVLKMYNNIMYILYTSHQSYFIHVLNQQLSHTSIECTQEYCNELFRSHEPAQHNQSTIDPGVHIPDKLQHVKYNDFVFGDTLGVGSFSTVCVAKYIQKGKTQSEWNEYAVKIINKYNLHSNIQYTMNFNNEVECLNQLHHPNITQLIGLCENPVNYYMILEYAKLGDLHTMISNNGSIDLQSTKFIAAEILNALQYIHSNGYIYSDVKPENIVIYHNSHIKLIDFGSARKHNTVTLDDRIEGTIEYLAPELVKHTHTISVASDLWSYACVIYQMLCGKPFVYADIDNYIDTHAEQHYAVTHANDRIFDDDESIDLGIDVQQQANPINPNDNNNSSDDSEHKLDRQHIVKKLQSFRYVTDDMFPDSFPAVAKSLLEKLLVADPTQRLCNYDVIKSDPFFDAIDFATIHTQVAPSVTAGAIKQVHIDSKWSRRKNSIMWAPNLQKYTFNDSAWIMEPLIESKDDNEQMNSRMSSSMNSSSRRNVTTRASNLPLSGISEESDSTMNSTDQSLLSRQQSLLPSHSIPSTRVSLPPRSHKPPIIPSSRKLGSSTSNKLLHSIMNSKKSVQIDEFHNK